jgi:methylase of polypeptide subunit release factors
MHAAGSDTETGHALDMGAGEGADAIRLAKLGYQVDAVEVSPVACEKAERFARAEGVSITMRNEPIETADLAGNVCDLVLNVRSHIKLVASRRPEGTRPQ